MFGSGAAKLRSSRPLHLASADVMPDSCGMDKIMPIAIGVVLLSAVMIAVIIWATM